MLVLSRKLNEKIQIGDVVVTVTKIGATRVMLGVQAPKEVKVLRGELVKGRDHGRELFE